MRGTTFPLCFNLIHRAVWIVAAWSVEGRGDLPWRYTDDDLYRREPVSTLFRFGNFFRGFPMTNPALGRERFWKFCRGLSRC
ncbi:hypothetical protein NPIL_506851 [Nephila pilipes]|uniref:Uncharacterized protein n=1 Tax=Nephila pilipes TaxID=299642 RepID=A0A8X6Q313_NEPPI|nr:hypothetical protein NPIL_506851 [Nephila pilipes]